MAAQTVRSARIRGAQIDRLTAISSRIASVTIARVTVSIAGAQTIYTGFVGAIVGLTSRSRKRGWTQTGVRVAQRLVQASSIVQTRLTVQVTVVDRLVAFDASVSNGTCANPVVGSKTASSLDARIART